MSPDVGPSGLYGSVAVDAMAQEPKRAAAKLIHKYEVVKIVAGNRCRCREREPVAAKMQESEDESRKRSVPPTFSRRLKYWG